MKQYKVTITPKALLRMQKIYDHIAYRFGSPLTAERQYNRIRAAIKKLSSLPMRRPVVLLSKHSKKEIRRLYVDNFSVFYTVLEEKKQVQVLSVIYSSSDFLRELADDGIEIEDSEF